MEGCTMDQSYRIETECVVGTNEDRPSGFRWALVQESHDDTDDVKVQGLFQSFDLFETEVEGRARRHWQTRSAPAPILGRGRRGAQIDGQKVVRALRAFWCSLGLGLIQ